MPTYAELGKEELTTLKTALTEEYENLPKAQGSVPEYGAR